MKLRVSVAISITVAFGLGLASYKFLSPIAKSFLNINSSPNWDYVDSGPFINNNYSREFKSVGITSSIDGTEQPAYFYQSTSSEPKPLVISLHTWSGDYRQSDPLANMVKGKDWHYLHPDVRGPNNHPDACLSDKVISDIDDAIAYAREHANVSDVYVVGVSGGGYTALGYYLKGSQEVTKVISWVPISNLKTWYYESVEEGKKYSDDILGCVSNIDSFEGKIAEMERRSPLLWSAPEKNTPLEIYAGINDSYDGSVSTIQSLNFYNKLAKNNRISNERVLSIISRGVDPLPNEKIGGRNVYLSERDDKVSVTIFSGSHEMLPTVTMQSMQQ